MSRTVLLIVAVTVCLLAASPTRADVIFSNLGPGDSYLSGFGGFFIGSFDNDTGVSRNQETAMPITISGGDVLLESIDAAIERTNDPPGTQDVTATIYTDAFVALASTNVATSYPSFGASGAPTHFDFSGQDVILEDGKAYFIGLGPTFDDETELLWSYNDQDFAPCAEGFYRSILTGGAWAPLETELPCSAFRVNGEVVSACPADLDGDGLVRFSDLSTLLAAWGTPGADLNGNGSTDFADLAALLAAWGTC